MCYTNMERRRDGKMFGGKGKLFSWRNGRERFAALSGCVIVLLGPRLDTGAAAG